MLCNTSDALRARVASRAGTEVPVQAPVVCREVADALKLLPREGLDRDRPAAQPMHRVLREGVLVRARVLRGRQAELLGLAPVTRLH